MAVSIIVRAGMHPALPCGSAAGTSYCTCAAACALCLHRHLLIDPLGRNTQSCRVCRRAKCLLTACWQSACSDLQLHVLMWQLAINMDMAQAGGVQAQRPLLHMASVRSHLDACKRDSLMAETMVTHMCNLAKFQVSMIDPAETPRAACCVLDSQNNIMSHRLRRIRQATEFYSHSARHVSAVARDSRMVSI